MPLGRGTERAARDRLEVDVSCENALAVRRKRNRPKASVQELPPPPEHAEMDDRAIAITLN